MTLQEQLNIIQAAINGDLLQYRSRQSEPSGWTDYPPARRECLFDFVAFEWRVKPAPREWWLVPCDVFDGFVVGATPNPILPCNTPPKGKPIHVREVLD